MPCSDLPAPHQVVGICRVPPSNHTFGKPPRPYKEDEHVAGVMRSRLLPDQLQPSPDLGKSIHEGWRNQAPPNRVWQPELR